MGDRPPGGLPPAPITNPASNPPPTQRTFFSSVSANEFFEQLQVVLEEQHAQTLEAQESFVRQINAPIVALTAQIERLLSAMPAPRRSLSLSSETENPRHPPDECPVSPFRSARHPPLSARGQQPP